MTATPTPTITPIVQYDFETSNQGWTYKGQVGSFDAPATLDGGVLGLCPIGSSNCFSYWESPNISLDPDNEYRIRWVVGSNNVNPDTTIAFRLRASNTTNWLSWSTSVNSYNSAAPYSGMSKEYDLYIMPTAEIDAAAAPPDDFVLDFDIMSFDLNDNVNSIIHIDHVTVERIMFDYQGTPYTWSFLAAPEGWTFAGTIGGYDVPGSGWSSGHLMLKPNGSSNCFSYWKSPDATISQNRAYRCRYALRSSVTDRSKCVQFRARANQPSNWRAWEHVVPSIGTNSPVSTDTYEYDFMIIPQMTTPTDTIQLAFDIMSFDPNDDTNSELYLEAVYLNEYIISPP
jgi:hypothetical protein